MDIGEVRALLGVTGEGVSHGLAAAAEDSTGSTGEESGEAGTVRRGSAGTAGGHQDVQQDCCKARYAAVVGDADDAVAGIFVSRERAVHVVHGEEDADTATMPHGAFPVPNGCGKQHAGDN